MSEFKLRALRDANWQQNLETGYISPLLDSGIPGCVWHRIELDADIPEGSKLEVSFYTSEGGDEQEGRSIVFQEGKDALLDVPPGRYIKLKIISQTSDQGSPVSKPVLRLAKIYYPRTSYLRYLPAIYKNDPASSAFLERFLSIFETELLGSEEIIDRMPSFFDPHAAPQEYVHWLADWLSLDLYEIVGENNREFLLKAMEFYRKKGTSIGLSELITFLIGKRCKIKEYSNNVFRSYGMEHPLLESVSDQECASMLQYHRVSMTVDTRNKDLLGNMGTFEDQVHYTFDSRSLSDLAEMSELPRSSPWIVGVFIPLGTDESLKIDQEDLYKIIKSFLPVFVDIIIILYAQDIETYPLSSIQDSFFDSIIAGFEELVPKPAGEYKNKSNWKWLRSYKSVVEGTTNHVGYRTFNDHIILDGEVWDISFDI